MAKSKPKPPPIEPISNGDYKDLLRLLQIELVKVQRQLIKQGDKVLILFEGRDGAGKDSTIKRVSEYLSPRETRVVALGKPSDRDTSSWFFQRYVPHLPAAEELVLFNRSWYNRAGVERVMGFCSDAEYEQFMTTVVPFEHMLAASGIKLLKYYLDIDKDEQRKRLKARREDPLKQWKVSPIDSVAVKHWREYSEARDAMFSRTHNPITPWHVVRAGNKQVARLNVIKHILTQLACPDTDRDLIGFDPGIVFEYDAAALGAGLIAR